MHLIDGQSLFNRSFESYIKSAIWSKPASTQGIVAPVITEVSASNPVQAYVSHSRLVADCPNCNGAEMVWRKGPYLMICANCGNMDINGKFRSVVLPDKLDEIEQILLKRPDPATRNWLANDSIDILKAENEANL